MSRHTPLASIASWTSSLVLLGCGSAEPDGTRDLEPTSPPSPIVGVALGAEHSCSLHEDGSVRCWGSNHAGAIDPDHPSEWVPNPTKVEGVEGAVQVVAGHHLSCVRNTEGEVRCWGCQRGLDDCPRGAVVVQELAGSTFIGAARNMLCGVLPGGGVRCRGGAWDEDWYDVEGLGGGGTEQSARASASLSVGDGYACALLTDGSTACWGRYRSGRIDAPYRLSAAVIQDARRETLKGLDLVVTTRLATALPPLTHARTVAGVVLAWGHDLPTTNPYFAEFVESPPEPVAGLGNASHLASGGDFACAADSEEGKVRCWGRGGGAWGGESPTVDATPFVVQGLSGVDGLYGGPLTACATASGNLWCWGNNEHFQLGDLVPGPVAAQPERVEGAHGALGLAMSDDGLSTTHHACLVTQDSKLRCWGENPTMPSLTSAPSTFIEGVARVSLGVMHGCAIMVDGKVRCWGNNMFGALGVRDDDMNTGEFALPPREVAGLGEVVDLAVGDTNTCAILEAGGLVCWGAYAGRGFSQAPLAVVGAETALRISSVGSVHCFVRADGSAWCWGGSGAMESPAWRNPVRVPLPGNALRLEPDPRLGCALSSDGSVWCWTGPDGGVNEPPFPKLFRVEGLSGITDIAARGGTLCAVDGRGEVWCSVNPMHHPTTADDSTPIAPPRRVPGLSGVTGVATAGEGSCAVAGGDVHCWGDRPRVGIWSERDVAVPISF